MSLILVLKRDIGSHWHISRNLKEPLKLKLLRFFWCFVYLLKAFFCGLRAIRHEQLGSQVVYEGQRLFISNWARSELPTLAGDGVYLQNVPRGLIKNVMNLREIRHRFIFGLSFYTSNWHQIDVHRKLYPEHFSSERRSL